MNHMKMTKQPSSTAARQTRPEAASTRSPSTGDITPQPLTENTPARERMNGKPVLYREAKTVLTIPSHEFHHKLLCDGIVFNLGDACAYGCEFCYVGASMWKLDKPIIEQHNAGAGTSRGFSDVVIRRRNSIQLLKQQLFDTKGKPRYSDPSDNRVVYSSTLVDVAANMELLRETAEACNLLLEHTPWQIRLLSKSNLLHKLIEDRLIHEKYHQRLIFGFSTGTLNDRVAKAIETGTPLVSKRLQSLHWLQDRGLRTFGMICPTLPQHDYPRFSRDICEAIRVDRCEHVWGEVINLRGRSLTRTLSGLLREGLTEEAEMMSDVCGTGAAERWEKYARATFQAHTKNVSPKKLRFLQYISPGTQDWWAPMRKKGALLLGSTAKKLNLTTSLKQASA